MVPERSGNGLPTRFPGQGLCRKEVFLIGAVSWHDTWHERSMANKGRWRLWDDPADERNIGKRLALGYEPQVAVRAGHQGRARPRGGDACPIGQTL